jgi:rod shape-determining protein MreB
VLDAALGRLSSDVAVDLGTSNTRVWVRGRGVAVEAPSVVAVERSLGAGARVVAVGVEAKRMLGRTPEHITAIEPVREGVIADYALAEALLRDCVDVALNGRPLVKPRMVVCVPQTMSDVERRAVQDSARNVGAREVTLVAKSVAAAVGAGLPIHDAAANVLIDLGGGITEISVVSLGGIVDCATVRVGGHSFDSAIANWVRERHNVLIGARTAEEVKAAVGFAVHVPGGGEVRATGRDLTTGIPREVVISAADTCVAVQPALHAVVEGLRQLLSRLSPELAGDVADRGLVLSGGSALLSGLDTWMREQTGLPVVLVDDPRRATVLGAGKLLDDAEALSRLAL